LSNEIRKKRKAEVAGTEKKKELRKELMAKEERDLEQRR